MIAILAVGQTFVIITGGIDLSVGAIVGFSTVIVAMLINAGWPIWAAVLVTLLVGLGDRPLPRLRHRQDGPAALHHHAGDADLPARHRPADDQRPTISINNDAFHAVLARFLPRHPEPVLDGDPGRRSGLCLPPSQPLGPLSLRGRLQCGGRAPVRRQCPAHHLSSPMSLSGFCAAFVGVLLASRIGIGNADAGRRLGTAGDRLVGHRRHRRCSAPSARCTAR